METKVPNKKIISLLFEEMINKQLKDIPPDKKLCYADIKRLCKHINSSIFDKEKCSMWYGYITNLNNSTKCPYINFYLRGKKVTLHRLLYINFIGKLTEDEYLKFNCSNAGSCCNINHIKKFTCIKKIQEKPDKKKDEKLNNIKFNLSFE